MTDEEKWRNVVAALSGMLPGMVDTFIARILQDPVYRESGLTIEDLRRSSHDALVAILGVLREGGSDMDALESIAAGLGKRRARQGLPLDSLVRAIRLDFSVLWDALSASALAVDPALLVSRTELVWRTVDTFASRVQARYVAELEDIERANADLQHQYLSQLLAPGEPSDSDLARIAGALRVDAGARFLVAAVSREDSLTVQRRLRHRPKRMDALFTFDQGHHTLVIHKRAGQGTADLNQALNYDESTLFEGMAVAVAPLADGLGNVRSSAAAAREVMSDLPMGIEGSGPRQPGAAMAVNEDGEVAGSVSGGCVEGAVLTEALGVLERGTPALLTYGIADEDAFAVGLTCGGTIRVFVEPLDW